MSINVTPIPRVIDLAAPAFSLGLANAAGSAQTAVASDSTLLVFDTTAPADVIVGSAVVGSATTAPRRDHQHSGLAGFDSTDPASVAENAVVGSATTAPHRDHVHPGIPGAGTVVDEAITRFNGTGGSAVQGYSSLSPTISDAGAITVTSGSLSWPATAISNAGANTMSDFEIGTWTPTLLDATLNAGESQGYEATAGHYLKIGPRVFIGCRIAMTSLGSLTGSEQANIGGLPFTSASTSNTENGFGFGNGEGLAITAGNTVSGQIYTNITHIRLKVWDATTGASGMTVTNVSADGKLIFSGQYTT